MKTRETPKWQNVNQKLIEIWPSKLKIQLEAKDNRTSQNSLRRSTTTEKIVHSEAIQFSGDKILPYDINFSIINCSRNMAQEKNVSQKRDYSSVKKIIFGKYCLQLSVIFLGLFFNEYFNNLRALSNFYYY